MVVLGIFRIILSVLIKREISMFGENIFDKLEKRLKKHVGFECPVALTSDGWDDYNTKYKREHPIMYFVFDVVIDGIGIYTYRYITNPWSMFWYGLRQRFVTHSTQVRIQDLNKYQYHDPSTILLHANFQVLVDFIEWEVGVFSRPKWYKNFRAIPVLGYFMPTIRNAEEGLKHLEWESKLVYNTDWGTKEDDVIWGTPVPQAIAAMEKRDLYLWWKNARPIRIDPMDASGLSKHYDDERSAGKKMFRTKTNEENAAYKILSDECTRIEKMYDDEDETNLIRLIKIRHSLWT